MKRLATVSGLTQVLNSVANGITVQDPEGKLVFVNQAAARMMNCESAAEVMQLGAEGILKQVKFFNESGEALKPSDLPGRKALQGHDEPEVTISYVSKWNPQTRWATISARPVYDDEGKLILAVNVIQDITPLKRAEADIKAANDRITQILEEVLEKTAESGNHPMVERRLPKPETA
ncbi:MAG TPA: PAS domain-containing protein [Candidatus Saccharimonadia bacterium]|jgi:PAS domain-containing protein|nr:PAS domain-containing protein [Candidatus Saccharimonadia bacterium]